MGIRKLLAVMAAAVVFAATAVQAAPAKSLDSAPGCAPGSATAAGVALFGNGTELSRTDNVGGLRTALVLEPYIAPGTRHRLIAVDGGWCDAEVAFNHAWAANGRSLGDGRAAAAAYAQLAAAPYFDQTSITSHAAVAGVHTITTHALTNGVNATWTVLTDGAGVRTAAWATTAYAVKPFQAQWEGLTAVNGATERYLRGADGLLAAQRGLPTGQIEEPAAEVSYTGPDGFKIVVGISDSRNAVDAGVDTGQWRADVLRMTRAVLAENYQDFYAWGFRGDWSPAVLRFLILQAGGVAPGPAKTGYVAINDSTSAYCQACVFIANDFQIHFVTELSAFLNALGYSYPAGTSERDVYADVLGHEMFHNWQNNYVKPASSGRSVPGSYSEGTARMQETLHRYSAINDVNTSLVYANDGNGCNGLHGTNIDSSLRNGWFQSPAYSACHFWLPFYGAFGLDVLSKLVTEGAPTGASVEGAGNTGKMIAAVEHATGKPYVETAARYAAATITGQGLTWGPSIGEGPVKDWGARLERYNPPKLALGDSLDFTLGNGGLIARELTTAGRVNLAGEGQLAVLRATATSTSYSFPASGALVAAPAAGERVYAVATYPQPGTTPLTLSLTAQ